MLGKLTCIIKNKGTCCNPNWLIADINSLKKRCCWSLARLSILDLINETTALPTGGGSPLMLLSPLEYKALSFSILRKGPKRNFQLVMRSKGHFLRSMVKNSHKTHRRMLRFSCNVALCMRVVIQETSMKAGSVEQTRFC